MGPYIALIIVMAAVFGICYLVDKGFTKLFRSKAQHTTGLSVRMNKKFASIGLLITVLGAGGAVSGAAGNWLLLAGGCFLFLIGLALVVYYMSVGIYYAVDSFVYSTFGKRTVTYRYSDIQGQQLYATTAGTLIELHMSDGKVVQLQPGMNGVDKFVNHAFEGWLQQTGKTKEECDFYDPANSCWFPPVA